MLCSCAAGPLPELSRERDLLRGANAPARLRDYGWAELALGNAAAGEMALRRARAAGLRDARTLLGLALRAHDSGDGAGAREAWLALLEGFDRRDAWAPASAEAAAQRLLGLAAEPSGTIEEQRRYLDRLLGLWARADRLPPEARQLLGALAAQLARQQGREADARAVDEARGCPRSMLVSGPYGHLPRLDLDRPFGPDDPAADPGRRTYRRQALRGCALPLEGPPGRPGVIYAVAWVRAPGGPLPLSVESGGEPWTLYVHGRPLHREREPERRRLLWLDLPAGWHALAFKVSLPDASGELQLSLPGARYFDGAPAEAPQVQQSPRTLAAASPRALSPLPAPRRRAEAALRGLLLAQQAYIRGAIDEGLRAVEAAGAPRLGSLTLLQAALLAEDRSRPSRIVRDRVRRALLRALEDDPALSRARVSLAHMELQEERPEQALALLDKLPAGRRPGWQVDLLRHRALKARGWLLEAERALGAARAAGPAACQPIEALIELRRELKDERGALAAARDLARCNPYSDRHAEELRGAGDLAGARQEFERLLRLQPDHEHWLASLADLQLALGDRAGARRRLAALAARYPRTASYRVKLANVLIDLGQRAAAEAALRDGLHAAPASLELHKALQALGAPHPMAADRVDGLAIVGQFARRAPSGARDAAVIVLDRTVTRVFPDGSRWTLTHNIIQVLSKDGIDRFGEVPIPEGAEVLTMRTIKADGTTREPEEFVEKESVSAPDLEAGDFVEFEYIDRDDPPAAFPGGFLTDRFFFASTDAALDRTEYVLVTPWEMPLQVDLRGLGPPAARTERRGDLRVTTWARRAVPRLQPEPPQAEPLTAEGVPSVRVGSGVTLAGWQAHLRDRWAQSLRPNDELRRTAAEVAGTGGAGAAELIQRARRLDAWVRKSVKPGGDTDEAATMVLARREGNLHVLLAALLEAAGVPTELWLVRPVTAPLLEGPLPPTELFSELLLAVGPGRGPAGAPLLWLNPAHRHAPAGFVRPLLRGGQALRLGTLGAAAPPALLATVEMDSDGGGRPGQVRDDRRVTMSMRLTPDGGGEVTVREVLSGWPAVEWREELERLPEDKVRKELEQRSLGFFFPGASLEQLRYGPLADDDAPFIVEYSFRSPQLARRRPGAQGGTELVLAAPYPALLGRRYVGTPQRTSPLQLSYVVPMVLEAEVELPPGAGPARPGAPVVLTAFGRFAQKVEAGGRALRLRAEFAMPARRVDPAEYAEFVAHARRVDAAEASAAVIPLAPSGREALGIGRR